jgi:peptide/nickel transport system substrate-binding protein
LVLTMALVACGGGTVEQPAVEEPAAEEPAAEEPAAEEPAAEEPVSEEPMEEEPTEEPAAEEPAAEEPAAEEPVAEEPAGEIARNRTVIFDIDGGRVADPELWNQFVPGSRRDHGYHQAMAEPLFILNYETGEIEPWLGESMTANDTLDVWTLALRDGVKWSDGEAFNADDVVFTVNMLLDNAPELNDSAALAQWIESVEKIDDLTVQFNLTNPNPRFQLDYWSVRIWGGPTIVPEHIWSGQDPLTFTNYDPEQGWPVFTGPYTLESVSETEFTYVRDDEWWGAEAGFKPLPQPERLVWVWYGPEETRAAAMAEDELDSMMDVTLGALLALQGRNPNVIAHFNEPPFAWVPDPCSRTFEFNHTVEPWNDPEMRWAINYAIDREEIVNIAYEDSTFASRHFFPAYPPLDRLVDLLEAEGLYEEFPLLEHNPDRAREIIESKGYTMNDGTGYYELNGVELGIDIATHEAFIEKQRIAQVIVEQLQRIGINATTRNEAGATWEENFNMGNFVSRMGWQTCGSVNEPWASMDTFNTNWFKPVGERTAGNQNGWRWSGAAADEYSAIVDEIGTLPLGDPAIDAMFVEAMRLWMAELPVIPITQAKKIIPFDTTYWTGWPTAENNYMHPPTWWQSTHAIIHNLQPVQ